MIIRRLLTVLPLLLFVSFAVFLLEVFLPGDAATSLAGEETDEAHIEEIRRELNLDDPLVVRYANWLTDAVRGDLGRSLFTRRPVTTEVGDRIGVTLSLVGGAVLVAVVVAVPVGLAAGRRPDGWFARASTVASAVAVAVPHFVIGMALVAVFGIWLDLLPLSGYVGFGDSPGQWLRHLVLPILALSGVVTAELTRQLSTAMASTLSQQHIRAAYAKGLRPRTVLLRHALPVAAFPAITVLSVQAARLFGAAVIVEEIFRLPGLGRLTVSAVLQNDLPVLQGVIPVAVLIAVGSALLADLAHVTLDPRLRRGPA